MKKLTIVTLCCVFALFVTTSGSKAKDGGKCLPQCTLKACDCAVTGVCTCPPGECVCPSCLSCCSVGEEESGEPQDVSFPQAPRFPKPQVKAPATTTGCPNCPNGSCPTGFSGGATQTTSCPTGNCPTTNRSALFITPQAGSYQQSSYTASSQVRMSSSSGYGASASYRGSRSGPVRRFFGRFRSGGGCGR